MPAIRYLTLLDYWFLGCIFFTFGVLIVIVISAVSAPCLLSPASCSYLLPPTSCSVLFALLT